MRLRVHFVSIFNTQNLHTNQFRENSQEQKFLNFDVYYIGSYLKILGAILEKFQRYFFFGENQLFDRFLTFSQTRKSISG